MNEILKTLKPEKIWFYFGEVLAIARPSKKEEKIRAYLVNFGKQLGLETHEDATGNVLIRKKASKGYENCKPLTLQSHMDMVCEKNSTSKHNFDTDPIEVKIEDGWLKAIDTTLGADNGIGVAMELAILASDDIDHGPLECLFTVDEETGLTGAFGLEPDFLQGEILLNLDSEDDGQFFIGCAGGIDTVIKLPYRYEASPKGNIKGFRLKISGLKGGHSGDDINKGLGNANKLLNRFLWEWTPSLRLRLHAFNGGNLRNAIAREAFADVVIEAQHTNALTDAVHAFEKVIQNELKATESGLVFTCEPINTPSTVLSIEKQLALQNALYACPHGVIRMSAEIPNFVETSTNLAAVKMENDHILITTSQRSSVTSAKFDVAHQLAACFNLIGAEVEHGEGYPGWNPNPNSEILAIIEDAFRKRFHQEPLALAIHAGLECGLFEEKYPGLDMVSYGPTMRGVHSPDERLEIATVERFWDLTLDILKRI
ncbi:MAG: aminoacyl-histidine dipeptidase, partial [Bacteroidales bacterium]